MSRIRSKNTKPEMAVRKYLHANGFRYILHNKRLPGKPDLSNMKRRVAVFVNGCFWHHHKKCNNGHWPNTNREYWIPKIKKNVENDSLNRKKLIREGYKVFTIWECETQKNKKLQSLLSSIGKADGISIN